MLLSKRALIITAAMIVIGAVSWIGATIWASDPAHQPAPAADGSVTPNPLEVLGMVLIPLALAVAAGVVFSVALTRGILRRQLAGRGPDGVWPRMMQAMLLLVAVFAVAYAATLGLGWGLLNWWAPHLARPLNADLVPEIAGGFAMFFGVTLFVGIPVTIASAWSQERHLELEPPAPPSV